MANFNIFKRFYGLCLWGSDPLNDSFYQILSFKGSEPHKQRPYNLLLMFFVSIKSIPSKRYKATHNSKWHPTISRVTVYVGAILQEKCFNSCLYFLRKQLYNKVITQYTIAIVVTNTPQKVVSF